MYRKYVKRLLDIIMAAAGIIVLSPVMLVTAFLVRVKLGSPVIFKQKRPGKNEKIFEMYKFRSMTDERDQDGNLLPDEVRLGEVGKKLRAYECGGAAATVGERYGFYDGEAEETS